MRILAKVGGAQLAEAAPRAEFCVAVRRAREAGHELVVVHGGGAQMRTLSERLGLEPSYVQGLRITDAPTAEVALWVLGGGVNRTLVAALAAAGVEAVGLTGADGNLFSVRRRSPDGLPEGTDLGYVGAVSEVRPALVLELCAAGRVPVVASLAPLARGEAGPADHLYNVNADEAAGPLAVALGADALLFLTAVAGVRGLEGERVPTLDAAGVGALAEGGALSGGMLPKLRSALAAAEAMDGGLVKIAPAAGGDALLAALEPGTGTRIVGGILGGTRG